MDPGRWDRIESIFHEAEALEAPEQDAFLEAACCTDPEMLAEVRQMIEENGRRDSILDRGLPDVALRMVGQLDRSLPVQEVGPYRLLKFIGEGGMGAVYLAERKDTGKRVAMKFLVGAGMSPARLERFTHEIRMHAQLAHAYIAAQYDAGTLPDGTPLFVMEYVEGKHFIDYCQSSQGSLESRLKLFRRVCEAVEYLHGKAIIHRDVKPSNVLVDASGTPRVLDFGIAKELNSLEDDRTRPELRLLTREYAAPEWIEHGIVDRSTDVYSLGVMLFEMLGGRRSPQDASEDEKRPSQGAAVVAGIGRAAWRELDKICQKALRRDPNGRYRSVEALIRDIDHFLSNEPLEVQRPTLHYRLEKFIRRNRTAVVAASLGIALFIGMAVFFTWRLATERNAALAEGARSERIQRFMLNMLGAGDRAAAPSNDLRVLTLLDRASEDASRLNGDSQTQAELHQTLGRMYRMLGEFQQSDRHLELALEKMRATPGVGQPQLADALIDIGVLRGDQAKYKEAERSIQDGLSLLGNRLPLDDPQTIRAKIALGRVLDQSGSHARAIQILQPLTTITPSTPEGEYSLSEALFTLADAEAGMGHYEQSKSIDSRVLSMDRKLYGESHPRIGFELANMASVEVTQGHYAKGEAQYREAVDILTRWYGDNQPDTLQQMTSLATVLIQQSKLDEARKILQHVLTTEEQSKDKLHPYYAWAQDTAGRLELKDGELDAAESHFGQALKIDRALFGDGDHQTAMVKAHLAQVFMKQQRYSDAEPLLEGSLNALTKTARVGNMSVPVIQVFLGQVLVKLKRYGEAEGYLRAGYVLLADKHSQPMLKSREDALENLAIVASAGGHPEEAVRYRSQTLSHIALR